MLINTKDDTIVESPYRTVSEAAEFLRLKPQTLNNMRSTGIGPSYYKHGRKILYHIDELVLWSNLHKYENDNANGSFM